jgi:hypothetical protein
MTESPVAASLCEALEQRRLEFVVEPPAGRLLQERLQTKVGER